MICLLTITPKRKIVALPSLQRIFSGLGENLRLARLRRKFSTTLVAERAGIARNTLRAIEHGDPNVVLGAYSKDLALIAQNDELGRKLQDAGLSIKARAPKKRGEG